jgi:hypothetical protein
MHNIRVFEVARRQRLPSAVIGVIYFTASLGFVGTASATRWKLPPKAEFMSRNDAYVFCVTPTFGSVPMEQYQDGTCEGALYSNDGTNRKLFWSRPLINNQAPIRVFVSNSGQYVVTVSEWTRIRFLPVVFYGHRGELINVYTHLDDIAPNLDKNLRFAPDLSEAIWIEDSLFFFAPEDSHFIIRLRTGKVLLFETSTGILIDNEWKKRYDTSKALEREGRFESTASMKNYERIRDNLKQLVLREALRLLSSEGPDDIRTAAYVLGQYEGKDPVVLLREMIRDDTSRIVERDGKRVREFPKREAAKKALETMSENNQEDVITEERIGKGQEKGHD